MNFLKSACLNEVSTELRHWYRVSLWLILRSFRRRQLARDKPAAFCCNMNLMSNVWSVGLHKSAHSISNEQVSSVIPNCSFPSTKKHETEKRGVCILIGLAGFDGGASTSPSEVVECFHQKSSSLEHPEWSKYIKAMLQVWWFRFVLPVKLVFPYGFTNHPSCKARLENLPVVSCHYPRLEHLPHTQWTRLTVIRMKSSKNTKLAEKPTSKQITKNDKKYEPLPLWQKKWWIHF